MAIIIVETGSGGNPAANSYVSEADLTTYAADRGITLSATDKSVLLIQAMDYLESLSYKGWKTNQDQPLQWPRQCVIIDPNYCGCNYFPHDEIPNELKKAQLALAVAIDQGNSPLNIIQPAVKREQVGEISVEYRDSAVSSNIDPNVSINLKKLLSSYSSGNVVKVSKA
jgi:hypothetical protein